jgi:hypothetical protein
VTIRIRYGSACNIPSPDDRRWCDNLDRWCRSIRSHNCDRGDEPVSASRNGFNVARRVGIIVKRVPHFSDGYAQAVIELNKGVFRPQALPNFFPSDNLSGPLDQHYEEPVREILNFHTGAVP